MIKKFCTKCGREFMAIGREVICPACKASAAEESKRAAVERAKRASWTGESVPVRISGRASTVIREYGAAHNLPFAAALDALLRTSDFFLSLDKAWVDVEPYKSRRRDKNTATSTAETPQDVPQDAPQPVKTAAKAASKATASKTVIPFGDFGVVVSSDEPGDPDVKKATSSKASTSKASKASKASKK